MSDALELPTLYQHSRRPQWGLAIVAVETPTKRQYQFEDGNLRTFKDGFYHLLEPVDRPLDEAHRIIHALEQELDVVQARQEGEATRKAKVVPVSKQMEYFKSVYPGGFQDETYLADIRGRGVERRLKRFREPVMASAQEMLSADRLAELLTSGDIEAIRESLTKLLKETDLAKKDDIEVVTDMSPDGIRLVAETLGKIAEEVPTGDVDLVKHFDRIAGAMKAAGKGLRWVVPSLLLAALHPETFPYIRRSAYREQARWMAPRLEIGADPSGKTYVRLVKLATELQEKLAKEELEVNDLFDVSDFIWHTLRPKAKAAMGF